MKTNSLPLLKLVGVVGLLLLGGASGRLEPLPDMAAKSEHHNLRRQLPPKNPCASSPCNTNEKCIPGNGNNYSCESVSSTSCGYSSGDACDVIVVGLGWAGTMTLYELQRYNDIIHPTEPLKFMGLEYDNMVGGRAQAAELVSGGGNPIMEHIFELYSQSPQSDDYLLYVNHKWSDITYFDLSTNDEIDSNVVNEAKGKWNDAFQCLQEEAFAIYQDTLAAPEEFSMRDVLEDRCNWGPYNTLSNLEKLLEWYEVSWEFLTNADNSCPPGNLPLATYTGEYQDRDQFISVDCHRVNKQCTEPTNGANIIDKIARTYIEDPYDTIIKVDTEVEAINWCLSGGKIEVKTKGPTYYAKRVVVTPSVAILREQMNQASFFNPSLTSKKEAIERTFLAEPVPDPINDPNTESLQFRDDIGLYMKITVVLEENTFKAAKIPDTEFFFVARPPGNSNEIRCGMWQRLDFGANSKEFFPKSRAFVCTLTTKEFEDTVKSTDPADLDYHKIEEDQVEGLIRDTLYKVLELEVSGTNGIGECKRTTTNAPLILYPPEDVVATQPPPSTNCVYQIRDGPETTKKWGRGWTTFTKRVETRDIGVQTSRAQDYNCIRANLDCNYIPNSDCDAIVNSKDPKLLFAGEAYCERYIGFQHGAYYSGIKAANEIIKAARPGDWDTWEPQKTPQLCDDPPVGGPGNYRESKAT